MSLVLVVDDAAFQRMRVRRSIESAGHTVIEATNGNEAMAVYEREHPDAVFMDITMPGMDGMQALKHIREQHPEARIAMLSALGQQGTVLEAVKAGARDFIVKPAETDRVLEALRKLLA